MKKSSRRDLLKLLTLTPPALGLASFAPSCVKVDPEKSDPMRQRVLHDLVAKVIVPTYADLVSAAGELLAAAALLEQGPDASRLGATQAAWRAARGFWKNAEAFYFGPVEDLALTGGAIDSWPAAGAELEALVSSEAALDVAAVGRLGANKRGFPALEQLLFDSSDEDAVLARLLDPETGARRCQLIRSLASDLEGKCKALHQAWNKQGGYGGELARAGEGSKKYPRQRDGIDEVVTGMLYLAELILMSKLAKPMGLDTGKGIAPELEEAARSDSTLAHLRENLEGLKAVYLCKRGKATGVSLSAAVREVNAGVDTRFQAALSAALRAVDDVPGSFREALTADFAALETLYQEVRAVKNAVIMDLAGALGASIGFGFSDTD